MDKYNKYNTIQYNTMTHDIGFPFNSASVTVYLHWSDIVFLTLLQFPCRNYVALFQHWLATKRYVPPLVASFSNIDFAVHSRLLVLPFGIHSHYRFDCYQRVTRLDSTSCSTLTLAAWVKLRAHLSRFL